MSADSWPQRGPGVERDDRAPSEREARQRERSDDAWQKGVGLKKARPLPRQRTLHAAWQDAMAEAVFGVACDIAPAVPVFLRNVKHLKNDRGVDDERLRSLFPLFARAVKAGEISVVGKNCWYVFLKSWHRLEGKTGGSGYDCEVDAVEADRLWREQQDRV